MEFVPRIPIVTVIGSGNPEHGHGDLAAAVGRLVAEMGFHLLTGGGLGVMEDACRGFASVAGRRGVAIGVIPRSPEGEEPKSGYPNPWVEIPIFTHLAGRLGPDGADSRNAINVLSAWKVVALPGREGTRAEIQLARRHGKQLLALLDADRLEAEEELLRFLEEVQVPHRAVRRHGDGWDLEGVRAFLDLP
ncbi:MAG TPA: hypothetical protein VIC28_13805 [Thermoanaerobaculia bacterium]